MRRWKTGCKRSGNAWAGNGRSMLFRQSTDGDAGISPIRYITGCKAKGGNTEMVSEAREKLKKARRWVVKIGSALLTNNGNGLHHASLDRWVGQIMQLRQQGIEVVLVSSGAIAEGLTRLGWKHRPSAVHELQ